MEIYLSGDGRDVSLKIYIRGMNSFDFLWFKVRSVFDSELSKTCIKLMLILYILYTYYMYMCMKYMYKFINKRHYFLLNKSASLYWTNISDKMKDFRFLLNETLMFEVYKWMFQCTCIYELLWFLLFHVIRTRPESCEKGQYQCWVTYPCASLWGQYVVWVRPKGSGSWVPGH